MYPLGYGSPRFPTPEIPSKICYKARMELSQLGKAMIYGGLVLVAAGLLLVFRDQLPGLSRLGKLPGDISYEGKQVKVYFPMATSLLLSLLLSLLFWLFSRR